MLREFLQYLTTSVPTWARRAGLLHQSIAMEARYRRCRSSWDVHYARCRAVIASAASRVEPGGAAVILGSGLARDIPFDALLARFDRVVLVDAVHLRSARRAAVSLSDIEWLHVDLARIHHPADRDWSLPGDTRLVVSLNVLGQLPLFVEADDQTLIRAHLALLASAPHVCLISDTDWCHEDGERKSHTDPWCGVPCPAQPPLDVWEWLMAPPGEFGRGRTQRHQVKAWLLEGSDLRIKQTSTST